MEQRDPRAHWRPIAYLSVAEPACRAAIARTLDDQGWTVIRRATGFHVIQRIAGVIAGETPWLKPGLIVIDAIARGCTGVTIARGLADLGIEIPVVLVTHECSPAHDGDAITVDPELAPRVVAELARKRSPSRFLVDPQLDDHVVA